MRITLHYFAGMLSQQEKTVGPGDPRRSWWSKPCRVFEKTGGADTEGLYPRQAALYLAGCRREQATACWASFRCIQTVRASQQSKAVPPSLRDANRDGQGPSVMARATC